MVFMILLILWCLSLWFAHAIGQASVVKESQTYIAELNKAYQEDVNAAYGAGCNDLKSKLRELGYLK